MNKGDRVTTPRGPGTIVRFHYEPVSLGTRNIRRIAWVLIRYDDSTVKAVHPTTITEEDQVFACSTTDIDESVGLAEEPVPEPDPTPQPPAPPDEGEPEAELVEWP